MIIKPKKIIIGKAWDRGAAEIIMPPEISRMEPKIWAKRYLIIASYSGFVLCWAIRGRKANRLSSIPAYIVIQLLAVKARREPVNIAVRNRIWGDLKWVILIKRC